MSLSSTATYIHTGGGHLIYGSTVLPVSSLASTSQGAFGSTVPAGPVFGAWVPINPHVRQLGIDAILTGSSAGALVTGSISIQVSNDGVTPLNTTAGVISFSSGASPQADGFTLDAHYGFIRAVGNTNTTMSSGSSMSVVVSPHLVR